jgi:AcrR family transcriptional regulator
MNAETYQRARRPEQKLARREAILAAAGELALRDGVRAVSLADIAGRVGIHKSALLRYFETREQIFLELAAAAWRDWTAALHAGLDNVTPDNVTPDNVTPDNVTPDNVTPDSGAPGAGVPEPAALVADVFARSFGDRPLLCDLIAHTPLNLERNVSTEAVRRYKLTSLGAVDEAAALTQRALPALTLTECGEFVAVLASLAGALWQIANPTAALAEFYAADPALARACVDLTPRLHRTAEILLAGFVPSRAR